MQLISYRKHRDEGVLASRPKTCHFHDKDDTEPQGDATSPVSSVKPTSPERLESKKRYRCDVPSCDKASYLESSLKNRNGRQTTLNRFFCKDTTCGKGFGVRSDLVFHERYFHERLYTGGRLHKLAESSTVQAAPSSPSASSATAHDSSHPFSCQTCHRSFTRRAILADHERTHTGDRPFVCKVPGCGQAFARQNDKTRHERTKHNGKKFVCGKTGSIDLPWGCGKAFSRKDGLWEHHEKTFKGRQCIAERDKIVALDGAG